MTKFKVIYILASVCSLDTNIVVKTENSKFGAFIEGACSNQKGNIYAVNYGSNQDRNTVGMIHPKQELFFRGKNGSEFGSMKFVIDKYALINDYKNHEVIIVKINDLSVKQYAVFCKNEQMLQPNDLTVSSNGDVFLSGMVYKNEENEKGDYRNGDIWLCRPNFSKKLKTMGRTNGIAITNKKYNPFLYVSESVSRDGKSIIQRIWRYEVNNDKLENEKVFANLSFLQNKTVDIDGILLDTEDNLYVTINGGNLIIVFDQNGSLLTNITTSLKFINNLSFGGINNDELFITGRCGDFVYGQGNGCLERVKLKNYGNLLPKNITKDYINGLAMLDWKKYEDINP